MPRLVWILMVAIIGAVALTGSVAIMAQRAGSLSSQSIGGPFTARDEDDRTVSQAFLVGKPTVLFFGYTGCPDVCPTTLASLARALHGLGEDANRLNVVFVTVDPQRDTPAVLKEYLSSFDPRFHGLTGTEQQISGLVAAFHIHRERIDEGGGAYAMVHSANALLLNKEGRVVGELYYGETDESISLKLATLADPPVCRPGKPGRSDLWAEQATAGPGESCRSS